MERSRENFLLQGHSEAFRGELARWIKEGYRHDNMEQSGIVGCSAWFEQFLDPVYVQLSIETINQFPAQSFAQFESGEEFHSRSGNFFTLFDGRSSRGLYLPLPAFIRLVCGHRDLVAEISLEVTSYRDFCFIAEWEDIKRWEEERFNNLPWGRLLEAYRLLTQLVDQEDLFYQGPEILPLRKYIHGCLTAENPLDRGPWRVSGMFFR